MSGSVYIAGHRGMVGSAILRQIDGLNPDRVITRTRQELDLCDNAAVQEFFAKEKPDCVIIAAAKVGGIHANNTYPADFIYENLSVALNIIHSAYQNGTKRLMNLGSSCIYPREVPQPMKEEALLSAPLEKTNEAYAVAKIAALKMCEYYRKQYGVLYHSAMPTNLYGKGDNYHPENSHVLPALIRRFHEAKEKNLAEVVVWGTGTPKREFLNVEDLASGVFYLLQEENPPDWVNIGAGVDYTIAEIAQMVKDAVGFKGDLVFDPTKPDGTPRKFMDSSKLMALGWKPKIAFQDGLKSTYQNFLLGLEAGTVRAS